jgi:hypothetical protein
MWGWLGFIVVELVGVAILVSLWRLQVSLLTKVVWTPILFLPIVGPLFFLGLFGGAPTRYRDASLVHSAMSHGKGMWLAKVFRRLLGGG